MPSTSKNGEKVNQNREELCLFDDVSQSVEDLIFCKSLFLLYRRSQELLCLIIADMLLCELNGALQLNS